MSETIDALIPAQCPHCEKTIGIKLRLGAPELVGILKEEETVEIINKINPPNHASSQEPDSE